MLAGILMLAGQAAVAKLLRTDYHAGEILLYRGSSDTLSGATCPAPSTSPAPRS